MKGFFVWMAAAVMAAGVLTGCGDNAKVDETKTVAQIEAELPKLNEAQIKAQIEACQKALEAKKAELDKLAAKIKDIPLTEILSDESTKLKDEAKKLGESVKKLTDQIAANTKGLEAKGKEAAR